MHQASMYISLFITIARYIEDCPRIAQAMHEVTRHDASQANTQSISARVSDEMRWYQTFSSWKEPSDRSDASFARSDARFSPSLRPPTKLFRSEGRLEGGGGGCEPSTETSTSELRGGPSELEASTSAGVGKAGGGVLLRRNRWITLQRDHFLHAPEMPRMKTTATIPRPAIPAAIGAGAEVKSEVLCSQSQP